VLYGKDYLICLARLLMNQEWKYSFPAAVPAQRTWTGGISKSRIIRNPISVHFNI
jgi:hypothetical protein